MESQIKQDDQQIKTRWVNLTHLLFIIYFYFVKIIVVACLDFSACFIYISYLGYYIYIGLIDWLDSRSLISGCPQFHSGWLPYTPHAMISGWPSIPRYSAMKQNGYYLCANICGCRKTGWRNPTGFLKNILSVCLFDCIYIVIYDVLEK